MLVHQPTASRRHPGDRRRRHVADRLAGGRERRPANADARARDRPPPEPRAARAITGNTTRAREVQATKPLNCATSRFAVADKDDKKDSKKPRATATPRFRSEAGAGRGRVDRRSRLIPHMKKIVIAILLHRGGPGRDLLLRVAQGAQARGGDRQARLGPRRRRAPDPRSGHACRSEIRRSRRSATPRSARPRSSTRSPSRAPMPRARRIARRCSSRRASSTTRSPSTRRPRRSPGSTACSHAKASASRSR